MPGQGGAAAAGVCCSERAAVERKSHLSASFSGALRDLFERRCREAERVLCHYHLFELLQTCNGLFLS